MFALLNTVVDGENSVTGDVACVARTDCCEPQSSAAATERDERKDMDIGRGREQDDGFVRNGLMPNSDASCVLCRRRRQTKNAIKRSTKSKTRPTTIPTTKFTCLERRQKFSMPHDCAKKLSLRRRRSRRRRAAINTIQSAGHVATSMRPHREESKIVAWCILST